MIKLKKLWGRVGLVCLLAGLAALAAGCTYQQVVDYIVPPPKKAVQPKIEVLPSESNPENTVEQPQTKEKYTLVLFFGDNQAGNLVAEKRQVPKVEGLARRAMNELIKGPKNAKLQSTIPEGTKLLDINVKADGLCIVNFSKELMTKHRGGSSGEALTVYAIVNTLTQFPTVKEVQILIEGERKETIAGHMDISQPLERDAAMVSGN